MMTRHVRDAEFWGLPIGTPIKPGMKPTPKPKPGSTPKKPSGTSYEKPTGSPITPTKKPHNPKRRITLPSAQFRDAHLAESQRMMDLADEERIKNGEEPRYANRRRDAHLAESQRMQELADEERVKKGEKPRYAEPDTGVRENKDFSIEAAATELEKINKKGRKNGKGTPADPIDCGDDIKKAHQLLGEGKHIRLNSPEEVSLLIDRLAEEAAFAKETGTETPDYDLCQITVPDTNLFCLETKGIPRAEMPQFSGQPVPGSYAEAKADADPKGEANVTDEFGDLLEKLGIKVETTDMPVDHLKATQSQLVGTKVAGMRAAMRKGKIKDEAIYVTKDGYIVDGHHRWAAKMALDLEDGKLGDVSMPVKKIDADIGYILDLSNGFTEMAGIKPKGTGKNAEGVKILARLSRLAGHQAHHACAGGTCSVKSALTDAYLTAVDDLLGTTAPAKTQ